MMNVKKLDGGGDKIVEQMMENATLLGIDLIELMWVSKNGVPRWSTAKISGFKLPVISKISPVDDDVTAEGWIDGTLYFYPDKNGRCWGYVYDCPENRKLMFTSYQQPFTTRKPT